MRHRFVDECLARADNLMLARKRRLVAQGVLNLLALADAETLKRAPAMLVLVNEVLVQEYKDSQQPARAARRRGRARDQPAMGGQLRGGA